MNFDLLFTVLVDVTDEVIHLPHELQVAEALFVRGHAKHVPHGGERAGEQSRWLDADAWKCISPSDFLKHSSIRKTTGFLAFVSLLLRTPKDTPKQSL